MAIGHLLLLSSLIYIFETVSHSPDLNTLCRTQISGDASILVILKHGSSVSLSELTDLFLTLVSTDAPSKVGKSVGTVIGWSRFRKSLRNILVSKCELHIRQERKLFRSSRSSRPQAIAQIRALE